MPVASLPTQAQPTVPIPDPTVRTIEQLQREIAGVKEQVVTLITGSKDVIETRLNAMDRAIVLLQVQADKAIDNAVGHLQRVHEEKFSSIETQFIERDTRTEQTSRDSKVAVDAALQAAKEAVGEQNKSNSLAIAKSEASVTKQIDQIVMLISSGQTAMNDKMDDIKARVLMIEGRQAAQTSHVPPVVPPTPEQHRDMWGYIVGAAGIMIAVMAIFAAVVVRMSLR
jgi:hypothetical protein